MPPTRSSKKASEDESTAPISKEEANQWIFFMNDEILETDGNIENKPVFSTLKHPKNESGNVFLFSQSDAEVYEITAYEEKYRSWFIENSVQKDGRIFFTTPVDPVFLSLPYLINAEKSGKFMTLDQILLDEEFPDCQRLTNTKGISELHHVADVKGADDLKAFKYSKDKTLSWLRLKTERLSEALKENDINVKGSCAKTYVRRKMCEPTEEDYLRFAHGIVSEYLPDSLGSDLREYMNIPIVDEKKENLEPPSKKQKMEDITPTEDYSRSDSQTKTKAIKMTAAQKQLSKVDKTGMKSIASFFSPKSK